ncbi:MAG: transposase [Deltaproteobacteria bacterium]|nr:transposase [Deltaproteobacteria bacterium]
MQDTIGYSHAISRLRAFFFDKKGFIEVPSQARRSILAACEDPKTLTLYQMDTAFPLPQTGQMWLEYELLKNPNAKGYFCISTSYRNEPNPIPGRHDKIFPMFEFESHGDFNELQKLETELCEHLGFAAPKRVQYEEMSKKYDAPILEPEQEEQMARELGPSISLERFPGRTQPFWNMKDSNDGTFAKIDVILYGQETIGSAERSCNIDEMRHHFNTVSEGEYSATLFRVFGKERVMAELDEYLSLPMILRFGGGIGVTRMVRAMREARLIPEG